MAVMTPVQVFLRLGDGQEYQIGSVTPDVSLDPVPAGSRVATCSVEVRKPLAALLREAADSIDPAD